MHNQKDIDTSVRKFSHTSKACERGLCALAVKNINELHKR